MIVGRRNAQDVDDELLAFREHVFDRALLLLGLLSCVAVILLNIVYEVPSNLALVLWFLALCTCCLSYLVRRSFGLPEATFSLILGMIAVNSLAATLFRPDIFLHLYSIIAVVSVVLLNRAAALLLNVILSVVIIQFIVPVAHALPSLALLWIVFLAVATLLDYMIDLLQRLSIHQSYAVAQMQDARESRALLAERVKALNEATQNLEYANIQLQHARRVAEENRRLKAQFAANVSHELRTPINLIVGFAEMMVSAPTAYGTALPSAYWADMNTIFRNAHHLQSLINDVLDISQLEAGQMAMVKEEVSLELVLTETADMFRDQIMHKGLAFEFDFPPQLPTLWIDRLRIRQVIINLLGNALRFTDQGAIRLSAELQAEHVLISVCDTGLGIPADELQGVFEEFYQLDASLSRRTGGSGLGLTLSRHFVSMHGGQIWVESQGIPGQGSCLRFTLPLIDTTASVLRSVFSRSGPKLREPCFIVLDSDPAMAHLFERYVNKQKVVGAADTEEALHLLDAQPTAIVADTAKQSAEIEEFLAEQGQKYTIIRCPMPSGRRLMQVLGVADYLVKPVTYQALHEALQRITPSAHTVLVVDDDKEIVRLFSRMLQTMPQSYEVKRAYGGYEALELMRTTCPDVVILDLLMPDIDGLTLVERMKTAESLASIPVIIASARGAAEAVTASDYGMVTVQKPAGFQPLELVGCVEAILASVTPSIATESP